MMTAFKPYLEYAIHLEYPNERELNDFRDSI